MTIRNFLTFYGYLDNPSGSKARCPFHEDNRPSAMIHDHDNTLWCYACRRLFTPFDIKLKFGVEIDEVAPEAQAQNLEPEYPWADVLFYS